MLINFVYAVILTEAVTEILTKSEIIRPFRALLFKKRQRAVFEWLHDLFDCGYCMSVWVGWFFAVLFFSSGLFFNKYVDWFFIGLILHRLSNITHNVIDRIYKEQH